MSFAKIYDALMEDIDFEPFYDFVKSYIRDKKTLIDAGCGSGYLTTLFARDFDVIGLDLDEDMLSLAKQRVGEHKVFASFYQHDLNDKIPLNVDAIVSLFDVINYLENPRNVLSNFYDALKDDGILVFDAYKEEVLDIYDGYEEEDTIPFEYSWKVLVEERKLLHSISTNDEHDEVTQFVHKAVELREMLYDIGFEVKITDGPDERKNYFIARKK